MENIEEIIRHVQHGEKEKFEVIIKTYSKQLTSYIYHMTNNNSDTEELLQDVFVTAYEKINKYKKSISFSAWLYKIAYNKTINYQKKKKLKNIVHGFDFNQIEDTVDKSTYDGFSEEMEATLCRLNLEDKNILYLRIVEELSYKEISNMLNTKESTTRKRFERAKNRFVKYYNEFARRYENEQCEHGREDKKILQQ